MISFQLNIETCPHKLDAYLSKFSRWHLVPTVQPSIIQLLVRIIDLPLLLS
jgi:hypothetical protein